MNDFNCCNCGGGFSYVLGYDPIRKVVKVRCEECYTQQSASLDQFDAVEQALLIAGDKGVAIDALDEMRMQNG